MTKLLPNVVLDKYKAKIVVIGYDHVEKMITLRLFLPIVMPQIIRVILTLVITMNWFLKKLDMNTKFLNGDLQEIVFMTHLKRFEDKHHPIGFVD